MLDDPSLLGSIAFGAIGSHLPFTPIVVIDQGEEVFTLARSPEEHAPGRRALDILRRTAATAGGFKLIMSLRTEYYGRLIDRLRHGLHDVGGITRVPAVRLRRGVAHRGHSAPDFVRPHLPCGRDPL